MAVERPVIGPFKERPPVSSAGLAISSATRSYYPEMVAALENALGDFSIRLENNPFSNDVPNYLVGGAERVVYVAWLGGPGAVEESLTEVALAGCAFTVNPDAAGENTKDLRFFFPYIELRGHRRTRNPIPDSAKGKAIVKAQGVTDIALARVIGNVAGASSVITIEAHNPIESTPHFTSLGINFVNLSLSRPLTEFLTEEGLITQEDALVVGSTDLGSLNSAFHLAGEISQVLNRDIPLAINLKTRIGEEVSQELIHGEVNDKVVVTGDDMIGSGRTTVETVERFLQLGAKRVIFCAAHAAFASKYYNNLKELLRDPRVSIVVSNSLPLRRDGADIAIPYARLPDGRKNAVRIMDIGGWLVDKVGQALKATTIEEYKKAVGGEIIKQKDPYQLVEKITGVKLTPPKDSGIYNEGIIYTFNP